MSREFKLTLLISLAHLPLGVLLYNAGSFAILHPIAAFFLGLYWALQKHVRLERVGLALAYFIGSEVLWRMAEIPVFWEFGKYGTAFIMITALVRRRPYKIPKLPLIYFMSLIPACILTFIELDAVEAKGYLSSNMSGPLSLVVSCWFFSNTKINVIKLKQLLLATVIPLLSVACVTLFYTATIENIQFTTESNKATSGGFGPNQVSSMLGLGVFIALSCFVLFKNSAKFKLYLGIAAVFFAAQSVMTFSRGGIYNAVGGILVLILFQFQNFKEGIKRFVPILALAILFIVLVFPFLNNFTGGKLQERFEETGTTNRTEIIQSDFEIFVENPVLGVGVGIATDYRERYVDFAAASHTEFSRLISEHGMFGIIALLSLIVMTIINVKRQPSTFGRALAGGVSVWCILYMFNAGMRLAAPSYMWGMTFITIINYRLSSRPIPPNLRKKNAASGI